MVSYKKSKSKYGHIQSSCIMQINICPLYNPSIKLGFVSDDKIPINFAIKKPIFSLQNISRVSTSQAVQCNDLEEKEDSLEIEYRDNNIIIG